MLESLVFLVMLIPFVLLVWAFLAPIESLGWYAGWYGADDELDVDIPSDIELSPANHFVVYLSGIGTIAGDQFMEEEIAFFDTYLPDLHRKMPTVRLINDIFPYSIANRSLPDSALLGWFWSWLATLRLGKNPITYLVSARNMFQVAVAADHRYGPIYNQVMAETMTHELLKRGYAPGIGTPITFIGYSGGAQISAGMAPFIEKNLHAPVNIISVGGVMSSTPGLQRVQHLYHIRSLYDIVEPIGAILFPGRWRMLWNSDWNRARKEGRITIITLPKMTHTAKNSYFDANAISDDGRKHTEITAQLFEKLIKELTPAASA